MAPLEICRQDGSVETLPDEEELSQYRWSKIFGVANSTVTAAVFRGGAEIREGEPRYPRQQPRRLTPVKDFPKIVDGFAETQSRPDGHRFHRWADDADTKADEFEVAPKQTGGKLIFRRHGG